MFAPDIPEEGQNMLIIGETSEIIVGLHIDSLGSKERRRGARVSVPFT